MYTSSEISVSYNTFFLLDLAFDYHTSKMLDHEVLRVVKSLEAFQELRSLEDRIVVATFHQTIVSAIQPQMCTEPI